MGWPILLVALPLMQVVAGGGPSATPPAPGRYAGSKACMTECHVKEANAFAATTKGVLFLDHPQNDIERLGCEGCHGPGADHIESGGEDMTGMVAFGRASKTPVAARNAVCLQCHERTARILWKGSAHESRDVACADCHAVMHEATERNNLKAETMLKTCARCHQQRKSQQLRFAHMPVQEGKIGCSSCHNPHGSPNDKLLVASSTNEVCYTCHAEKRGPFLWEHAPVSENCSNCHDPHGSNHEKMLTVAKARLCQQCHVDSRHPSRPYTTADIKQWGSRQCANCHTMIHGSNHPSGHAFTR